MQETIAELIEPLETAAITAMRFQNLCRQLGLNWAITWFWCERRKHGRLLVRDPETCSLVVRLDYARSTSIWTGSDSYIDRGVRTGSPRHLAILAAIEQIKGWREVNKRQTRRQLAG